MTKILLEDHFENNSNGWAIGENETGCSTKLANGRYYLQNTQADGFYASWMPVEGFEQRRHFSVEISLNIESGQENRGFGLIWGQNNAKYDLESRGTNRFLVSSNGHFMASCNFNSGDQEIVIADWTHDTHINQGLNASNVLRIEKFDEKSGPNTYFFINNNLVHSSENSFHFGNEVGFVVFGDATIAVDYLKMIGSKYDFL